MVANASSRTTTSRESEDEIETSYSESDRSPNADHDDLSEDEKSGATMAPVDNNSYRCVMFTDSYARVRLSECKDMVLIRNPGLKADVPATPLIPAHAADIVAHAGNDIEDADAGLVFEAANVEPSIEITGADSKFAPSMRSQSLSPESRKIVEGFAVIGVFLKAILVSFGGITSKLTLMLKMWIVSTFSSLFQRDIRIVLLRLGYKRFQESRRGYRCLSSVSKDRRDWGSVRKRDFGYGRGRRRSCYGERLDRRWHSGKLCMSVFSPLCLHLLQPPVANEIPVDDAILLTSLPTSASSDEDANITEMSLSSNVVSAPEASAGDTATTVVSEVVLAYEKADQKEAEMGSSTGYNIEVKGSELIDAVNDESLLSSGSSATLCDEALSVMVDLAPGLSIEDGAHAVDSQRDGTLQPMDTFESADNLKHSDIEDEDVEVVNAMKIDNLLGETSSVVLSDDALSAAGDSSSGSLTEEGTHAADSGLGTSELMVILESTEPLEVSNEIGPMESVIPDSDDSEVSATSLESSVNEEGKGIGLEDASTLPAFPSAENAIVTDSALCNADSSTSTSDTCVDSFSSLENAAATLPSEPSAILVPAEMNSAPSPTVDEVPEVAERQVAWVKRPANRRGGGGPARKRAREQRVAIFKDMPFWDDADDASPVSTPDNVAPSASSTSTSDSVASSSEPSMSPRISSAPSELSMPARDSSTSTPDDASSECSVSPRMSASTAIASLADAAAGNEQCVPDKCDRRIGDCVLHPCPNSNDHGPSGSNPSSDSRRCEECECNDRRGQGLSNGYRCCEDHSRGERRNGGSSSD
ncbi:hypothetical protein DFH11DRAFT_344680 [Phellopilus nigrolimitatus]|nr:hypothetical protein DFH11DRAFT_344680 [Phellopilus nigrolimitatus]